MESITIKSVDLNELDAKRDDRRGILAEFHLGEVPNMEYRQKEAIKRIQCLFAALGDNLYDQHSGQIGKPGEQADSFVSIARDGKSIILGHKYWGNEKITAFRKMVEVLAPVHRWKVLKHYIPK